MILHGPGSSIQAHDLLFYGRPSRAPFYLGLIQELSRYPPWPLQLVMAKHRSNTRESQHSSLSSGPARYMKVS